MVTDILQSGEREFLTQPIHIITKTAKGVETIVADYTKPLSSALKPETYLVGGFKRTGKVTTKEVQLKLNIGDDFSKSLSYLPESSLARATAFELPDMGAIATGKIISKKTTGGYGSKAVESYSRLMDDWKAVQLETLKLQKVKILYGKDLSLIHI